MSKDPRRWVLEHENSRPRQWHYFPEDYGPALCLRPPIPGMPIVGHEPMPTLAQTGTCAICYQIWSESLAKGTTPVEQKKLRELR